MMSHRIIANRPWIKVDNLMLGPANEYQTAAATNVLAKVFQFAFYHAV